MNGQNNGSKHYYYLWLDDLFCLISTMDTASFWKEKCFQTDWIHLNKKGKRRAERGAMAPDITIWKYCLCHMTKRQASDGQYYNQLLNILHLPCIEIQKYFWFLLSTVITIIGIIIVINLLHIMLLLANFKSPYRC